MTVPEHPGWGGWALAPFHSQVRGKFTSIFRGIQGPQGETGISFGHLLVKLSCSAREREGQEGLVVCLPSTI